MTESLDPEGPAPEPSGDYPEPTTYGTTLADGRHVSPEEAEQALNVDDAEEELPPPDEAFDEE